MLSDEPCKSATKNSLWSLTGNLSAGAKPTKYRTPLLSLRSDAVRPECLGHGKTYFDR